MLTMNCMKCGRDIQEGQVFCDNCLEVMRRYPVKPNTAVQLPQRKEIPARGDHPHTRKSAPKRRQPPTAEEKLQTAMRFLRRILVLWLITLGLLIASLFPAVKYLLGESFRLPGQNYSTFSTAPTETSAPAESTEAATAPQTVSRETSQTLPQN